LFISCALEAAVHNAYAHKSEAQIIEEHLLSMGCTSSKAIPNESQTKSYQCQTGTGDGDGDSDGYREDFQFYHRCCWPIRTNEVSSEVVEALSTSTILNKAEPVVEPRESGEKEDDDKSASRYQLLSQCQRELDIKEQWRLQGPGVVALMGVSPEEITVVNSMRTMPMPMQKRTIDIEKYYELRGYKKLQEGSAQLGSPKRTK